MRALVLLLAACASPAPVAPDARSCNLPMNGWFRQSASCVTTVGMSRERFDELSRLRDAFVLFEASCPSDACGPTPAVPPMPGVMDAGGYLQGDCATWRTWDDEMTRVAVWAQCAAK